MAPADRYGELAVNLVCSRCHTQFSPEAGRSPVCPECGAEAGLEPGKGPSRHTYGFAAWLGVCVALALGSLIIGLTAGGG